MVTEIEEKDMMYAEGAILRRITYRELKDKTYDTHGDDYGVISDYFNNNTKKALLSNPNYDNDTKTVLNVVIYKDEIVGRHMLMPTQIKIGDRTVKAQTGGGHEINDRFQGKGFGTLVVHDTILNSEYPIYIGQLYSSGAISILKKMDICIFGKPLYNKDRKKRSVLVAKGYRGIRLAWHSFWGDLRLRFAEIPNMIRFYKLKYKYTIKQEKEIPEWITEMVLQDGHKYMEIHDREWFQWNLENTFSSNAHDKNYFYAVYEKDGTPAGFYMTKERFEENKKGTFKNLVRGTVVEWGSSNECKLSEFDLNIMALFTFGKQVDKVNTVISSSNGELEMKKLGFEFRGIYQMTFKPSADCEEEMRNQENWRIRYGGCNTILV